jgi:hypothetical protein
MSGAVPLLPPYALLEWARTNFPLLSGRRFSPRGSCPYTVNSVTYHCPSGDMLPVTCLSFMHLSTLHRPDVVFASSKSATKDIC